MLTCSMVIATVRRFREYPECAVTKRRGSRFRPPPHWIQRLPQHAPTGDDIAVGFGLSIAPATPSFSLYHGESYGDGLCGPEQRNGVGSPSRRCCWNGTPRPPSTVFSFEVCGTCSRRIGRVQDSELRRDMPLCLAFCASGPGFGGPSRKGAILAVLHEPCGFGRNRGL